MNLDLLLCDLSCQRRCININEIGDNGSRWQRQRLRGAFGQALQTVLEPEGGDGGQSGVLFAFGAYLSVCFLFVSYILFSFYINFLLALFSFSDFVYFAGRACARL